MSHETHYRSFRGLFYRSDDPTNLQYHSSEGQQWLINQVKGQSPSQAASQLVPPFGNVSAQPTSYDHATYGHLHP